MIILVRTDASPQIGTGHLMRCLALAQACKERGHVPIFVFAMETPLKERLRKEEIEIARITAERGSASDAEQTISIARHWEAEWIVIDGYAFDATYSRKFRDAGFGVLMIDDYAHQSTYECDLLLNQNIDTTKEMYKDKTDALLLLGTEYSLLRKEFLEQKARTREISEIATNILVTLGGGDPQNATAIVLKALDCITNSEFAVNVILGSENPYEDELKKIIAGSKHRITLLNNITDMPPLMATADIAIAAAGSTSWELLFMGLPFITGILAENQAGIAAKLGAEGLAVNMGWYRDVTAASLGEKILALLKNTEARRAMSERGKKTVDGGGAERVIAAMISHSS